MIQKHSVSLKLSYVWLCDLCFYCVGEQSADSEWYQQLSCYWWICPGNYHSQELQRFADIPQHLSCQQFCHFIIPPPLLISAASDWFFGVFFFLFLHTCECSLVMLHHACPIIQCCTTLEMTFAKCQQSSSLERPVCSVESGSRCINTIVIAGPGSLASEGFLEHC